MPTKEELSVIDKARVFELSVSFIKKSDNKI